MRKPAVVAGILVALLLAWWLGRQSVVGDRETARAEHEPSAPAAPAEGGPLAPPPLATAPPLARGATTDAAASRRVEDLEKRLAEATARIAELEATLAAVAEALVTKNELSAKATQRQVIASQ